MCSKWDWIRQSNVRGVYTNTINVGVMIVQNTVHNTLAVGYKAEIRSCNSGGRRKHSEVSNGGGTLKFQVK